jgi:RNA polymerase sigma-70 factor (ECF subfamily)
VQRTVAGADADAADDDAALVAAARARPEAFTSLYDRYAARVYSYCYLRLGSREAAEDAMSETFLKAFADLDNYRGGLFVGWLMRIAQFTVVDVHRRNRRRPALPLDAAGDVADPTDLLEERVAARSELESLRAALRQLPADQRAVLELQLAELSPQEIAAALGRSLNAVRHLRLRAIRSIRPLLGEPVAAIEQEARGGLAC